MVMSASNLLHGFSQILIRLNRYDVRLLDCFRTNYSGFKPGKDTNHC